MASLQEDGVFSASSHLRYRNGIPRDIRDFTLCAWLSLNYLRGELNYWLSIGNDTHEDLLSGGNTSALLLAFVIGPTFSRSLRL